MRNTNCLQIGFVHIRSPVIVCLFWFLVLYFDGSGFALVGLLTAVWHELGHVLCYWFLYGTMPQLTISVTGIGLVISQRWMNCKQKALLAFSGPAINLLAVLVLTCIMEQRFTVKAAAYWSANLLTAFFNLLPVPPLDGFQILCCMWEFWANKLHFRSK